jgi:hypothetical protein
LLLAPGAASADWFALRGVTPPTESRVYVCHGYSCRIVTPVTFSQSEMDRMTRPLRDGPGDPAAERTAISDVVQIFETIVGARTGTSADLAKMQFGQGKPDQMDCLDEATNTTSLLTLLAQRGLLRHHTVKPPSARGFFLDGRYPHATAVLAENGTGEKWAIDSWPRANAEPPVVQRLSEWKRARAGDELPS